MLLFNFALRRCLRKPVEAALTKALIFQPFSANIRRAGSLEKSLKRLKELNRHILFNGQLR